MKQIIVLPSFERCVKKLIPVDREQLARSLGQFNDFIFSGEAPVGLGFKKINHDKYEFRAGLRLRVVLKEQDNAYYLVLVGNHDEVKRYLRSFR